MLYKCILSFVKVFKEIFLLFSNIDRHSDSAEHTRELAKARRGEGKLRQRDVKNDAIRVSASNTNSNGRDKELWISGRKGRCVD